MISNLSSIGTGSTQPPSGTDQHTRPSPDELFKKLDSDNKGYLSESDFASISWEGSAKAEEMFKKTDTDGDGKVTEAELTAAAQKMERSGGGRRAEGAEGAHGGHGGGQKSSSVTPSSSSSSSGAQTYNPADANQDGKVTEQEQQAYDAKKQPLSLQASEAVQTYGSVASAQ